METGGAYEYTLDSIKSQYTRIGNSPSEVIDFISNEFNEQEASMLNKYMSGLKSKVSHGEVLDELCERFYNTEKRICSPFSYVPVLSRGSVFTAPQEICDFLDGKQKMSKISPAADTGKGVYDIQHAIITLEKVMGNDSGNLKITLNPKGTDHMRSFFYNASDKRIKSLKSAFKVMSDNNSACVTLDSAFNSLSHNDGLNNFIHRVLNGASIIYRDVPCVVGSNEGELTVLEAMLLV